MDRTNTINDSLKFSPNNNLEVCTVAKALEVSLETLLKMQLPILLGEACDGIQFVDLQKAPHILVAGGTKGERNAFLNRALRSLCAAKERSEVWYYLLGEQVTEWMLPNISRRVYCDSEAISSGLNKLLDVLDYRYEKLLEKGLRSSETLRRTMPFIVVLIDGIDNEIEPKITRLASQGSAVGIHLILSAQSASKNLINGWLKANFRARVAFRTETAAESEIILDCRCAKRLAGDGDMLFEYEMGIQRIQMCRDE